LEFDELSRHVIGCATDVNSAASTLFFVLFVSFVVISSRQMFRVSAIVERGR
jgi:hypothetical protein